MARLFESYVMVDWSAASKPATGADSIWIGALTPDSRLKLAFKATNPPTRAKAIEELTELLNRCLKRGDRVLVGVDFPLGFPAGTSEALKLKGEPRQGAARFPAQGNEGQARQLEQPLRARGADEPSHLRRPLPVLGLLEEGRADDAVGQEDARARRRATSPNSASWKNTAMDSEEGAPATGVEDRLRRRHRRPGDDRHPGHRAPAREIPDAESLAVRPAARQARPGGPLPIRASSSPRFSTTLNATNQQASEIRDEAQVRTLCEALAERDANGKLAAMFAGEAKLSERAKDCGDVRGRLDSGDIASDFPALSPIPGLRIARNGTPN